MVEHRDVHRRHAVGRRAFLLFDRSHHLHRIELFEKHHRRAVIDAAHDAEHAAEAVEKRHGDADAVAAGEVLARADPETVVGDVAVGELHALRKTGRAGSVLHVDDVVHVALRLALEIFGLGDFAGEGFHLVQGIHAAVLLAAEEEHALQMRILLRLEFAARAFLQLGDELVYDLHVVAVAEAVDDEKVLRLRLRKREIHLVRLVVRVERQENGADLRRREHENHPVRNVRRPQRHLLAALDPERHQPLGDVIDLLGKFEPGEPVIAVGVDDRVVLAASGDRLVKKLTERVFARHGQIVPRPPGGNRLPERRGRRRRSVGVCQLKFFHCLTPTD